MTLWTQLDETRFIEELGTFKNGAPDKIEDVPKEVRVRLLRGYLEGLRHRRDWTGLIRERCEWVALAELGKLTS